MKSPKNRIEACPNNIGYTKLVSLLLHRTGCFSKCSFINLPFVFINFRLSYISISVLKLSGKTTVPLKIIRERLIGGRVATSSCLSHQGSESSSSGNKKSCRKGHLGQDKSCPLEKWLSAASGPSHVPFFVRSALAFFLKCHLCPAPCPTMFSFFTLHSEMRPLCLPSFDAVAFLTLHRS